MTIAADQLTFGIEIECTVLWSSMQTEGWTVGRYHDGAPIPGFNGWTAQRDGSLSTAGGRRAVEVVSPVLQGEAGLAEVERMLAKLATMGARVNRSCGFHVHVGFRNAGGDAAALQRLTALVAHVQPGIYAATGTRSREFGRFCASIKGQQWKNMTEDGSVATLADVALRYYGIAYDRYRVLNLRPLLEGRKTVEFRAFGGSVKPVKVLAYIQLCLGLVQRALNGSKKVAFDAPDTTRGGIKRKGFGATEVERLLAVLGWTSSFNQKPVGILRQDSIGVCVAELRRLGAKYDEEGRAQGVA